MQQLQDFCGVRSANISTSMSASVCIAFLPPEGSISGKAKDKPDTYTMFTKPLDRYFDLNVLIPLTVI